MHQTTRAGLKMVNGCLAFLQTLKGPKMVPYINRNWACCTTWFLTLWTAINKYYKTHMRHVLHTERTVKSSVMKKTSSFCPGTHLVTITQNCSIAACLTDLWHTLYSTESVYIWSSYSISLLQVTSNIERHAGKLEGHLVHHIHPPRGKTPMSKIWPDQLQQLSLIHYNTLSNIKSDQRQRYTNIGSQELIVSSLYQRFSTEMCLQQIVWYLHDMHRNSQTG